MLFKQSTPVVISFGPFVDNVDGVTLETGLVSALDNATTGIMLSKNGGTLAVRQATVTTSTYDAHGCYKVTLDATDVGTLGTLRVIYTDAATCLPVWQDFRVVPANVYDSLVGGSDLLQVDVANLDNAALSTHTAGMVPADQRNIDGAALSTHAAGMSPADVRDIAGSAVSAAAAQLGVNVVNVGGTAQTARDLGGALPAAAPGANGGLPTTNGTKLNQTADLTAGQSIAVSDKTGFSLATPPPTAAAIADEIWDEPITDHLAGGSTGASLNAAGAAGDPWSTPIPGVYGPTTAGGIVGGNLNATVSSRSSHSAADVWAVSVRTLSSFGTLVADIVTAVWGAATRTLSAFGFSVTASTVSDKTGYSLDGTYQATLVTAIWGAATRTLSSFGTLVADIATAVWGAATRTLSAFGFNVTASSVTDKSGYSLATTPASATALASVAGDVTAIGSLVVGINAKTTNLPPSPAAIGDVPTAAQVADKLLGRNIAGAADGGRTVTSALRTLRNKVDTHSVPGSAIIYREDDTTEDHRRNLITDASALPIVTEDPTT